MNTHLQEELRIDVQESRRKLKWDKGQGCVEINGCVADDVF